MQKRQKRCAKGKNFFIIVKFFDKDKFKSKKQSDFFEIFGDIIKFIYLRGRIHKNINYHEETSRKSLKLNES